MSNKLTIAVDQDGWTKGYQVSINLIGKDGGGHGYRIAGPKFNGSSTSVVKHTLTERDAREIRAYLDRVFPLPIAASQKGATSDE